MVIYVESVLIDNIVINWILLFLTAKILSCKSTKTRQFCASIFGAIMAIIFPLFMINNIVLIILKLLLGVVMILIAYKNQSFKEFIIAFILFLFLTAVMGGLCFMLCFLIYPNMEMSGGNFIYKGLPMGIVVLIVFVGFKLLYDLINFLEVKTKIKKFKYKTKITKDNSSHFFTGYLDSGNVLTDKQTLKPVIVISLATFKKINNLSSEQILKNTYHIENSRYININTATGSSKMLVFEVDEVVIESEESIVIKNAVLGVSLKNFKSQFDCDLLLNLQVMK